MDRTKSMIFKVFYVITSILLVVSSAEASGECKTIHSDVITLHFGVETGFQANDPNVFDEGHTHIDVSFTNSGWAGLVESEESGNCVAAEEAFLHVNEIGRWNLGSVPPGYEFIGFVPGENFWILDQNEIEGLLCPGFGADSDMVNLCEWNPGDWRNIADVSDKWIRLRLVDVRGPVGGELSVWQSDVGTNTVFMSTYDGGITEEDSMCLLGELHCFHVNWAFTKAGYYEVDVELSTVYMCDGSLSGDLDGDCVVDIRDFAVLAGNWLETGCGGSGDQCEGADIDEPGDGEVGISDLAIFAGQWLECGYPGCENRI